MLVVGLTGGIATGKSTVSTLFRSYNVPIIDADILAREVVEPGTRAHNAILREFGDSILLPPEPDESGTRLAKRGIDRKKLGGIVFNDEEKRKKLNGIVHPAVRRAMIWAVLKCWMRGEKVCVVDVPLLVEAGFYKWVGKVVLVYCSPELQLRRLMARDRSTPEDASSRLASQLPISAKLDYADIVLDNSGSPKELEDQVEKLVKRLKNDVSWRWWLDWLLPLVGVFDALWCLLWRMVKRHRRMKKGRSNRS